MTLQPIEQSEARFELPVWLRGTAPQMLASINAMLLGVESVDYDSIASLVNLETLGYDELEAYFEFFRIKPLFSREFPLETMRSIARRGDELYRLRGKAKALTIFSNLVNVFYTWNFRRDDVGRVIGIHFLIAPPVGVRSDVDWTRYIYDAFTFLLPVRLTVDEFTFTLAVEGSQVYVGSHVVLSHDIP